MGYVIVTRKTPMGFVIDSEQIGEDYGTPDVWREPTDPILREKRELAAAQWRHLTPAQKAASDKNVKKAVAEFHQFFRDLKLREKDQGR